ncbi:MAG: type II toxin-antitoxin system PemK/MazF family toxin [Candidatus Glassbacteria bacterium]
MRQYNRGEIWWVKLFPTKGREMDKLRPCVVVSSDSINRYAFLRIIVPLIEWDRSFSSSFWMIKVNPSKQNGLNKTVAADAFQIRCVDAKERFTKLIGTLEPALLEEIVAASAICIEST